MPLSQDFHAPLRQAGFISLPVAANTTIYAGSLVARNATGYAVPASDTEGLVVLGRAETRVVNGATAGAVSILIRRGVFKYKNDATNPISNVHIGTAAYIKDDATVSSSGGTNTIVAGLVDEVADDGVWINTGATVFAVTVEEAAPAE